MAGPRCRHHLERVTRRVRQALDGYGTRAAGTDTKGRGAQARIRPCGNSAKGNPRMSDYPERQPFPRARAVSIEASADLTSSGLARLPTFQLPAYGEAAQV